MPPKNQTIPSAATGVPRKRKTPPQSCAESMRPAGRRGVKRVRTMNDARSIITQTADSALKNGELDLQSFLKAREFEIKALQDGMQKAKGILTTRAFQSVPRDMRRRTASHNVKRVPKRLQNRAAREMREDNTPTVKASKREPRSSRGRLRAETAKRLGILAEKKRALKARDAARAAGIQTRAARPKLRKDMLNDPPKPKSKFRKRQIHKTWLPTHTWHAKRATITEPKEPLWRFAIPLTSTQKSYRPTHRASGARGAVAWDMSYMSTIGLEGKALSIEKLLKAVGVIESGLWEEKGTKWRLGKRSWTGWLSREAKDKSILIGPSTVLWCPTESEAPSEDVEIRAKKSPMRRAFIRVHPPIFLETWTEILRLSKLQRPVVHVEDLRFEIGSIEIIGPASTEALLGILHPYDDSDDVHGKTFSFLTGVTNPGSLPANSILSFPIEDPRLKYPPRPVKLPNANDEEANFSLLELLSDWPVDTSTGSPALFDRDARFKATRLPSQKSLNRRKSLARPGAYPSRVANDPPIPIVLLTSRISSSATQGIWTLLAPWKCILPIWYGLIHQPLSTGGNPRFGGLQEIRQIHFEQGVPWFPVDYPGTPAGFAWECEQRLKRHKEWSKRPKGKRIEWTSLDLGAGRKGEIGRGWACDFEKIIGVEPLPEVDPSLDTTTTQDSDNSTQPQNQTKAAELQLLIQHLPRKDFTSLISSRDAESLSPTSIATIRISFLSLGIAHPCARIYRLPAPCPSSSNSYPSPPETQPATTRAEWLSLLPQTTTSKPLPKAKANTKVGRIPLNTPLPQRVRLLAQSLLDTPAPKYPADKNDEDGYPLVPGEEDLIGFVTTGEFNLAEGKGVAIGSVVVSKVLEGVRRCAAKEGNLCIIRNAGEKVGRLARWEAV
ncbi:related to ribonuclease P chain POP1 [Phialocephala subalpina]|uniref:Related to ribonuclease P chain POP1 n=1 Tax=Phialocephala subalpina TaxID=576137 RepID=A0A1L7WFS8_9HELO|nr:related to ribonuclease P chain POP1 [Phialocephala subalpina]